MALRFLLDIFTSGSIQKWKKFADTDEEYEVRLHHHLEGLRFAKYDALLDSLRSTKSAPLNLDGWFRIVDFLHSLTPLSPKGSLMEGGRFNIGNDIDRASSRAFPALYLAENHETAYREKFGAPTRPRNAIGFTGGDFALRSPTSYSSLVVRGNLQNVFDLREHGALRRFVKHIRHFTVSKELIDMANALNINARPLITTSKAMLTSLMDPNWRFRPSQYGLPSNPQLFGGMLLDAGFDGVIYRSTKSEGLCVAAFPTGFPDTNSFVELRDPSPASAVTRLDTTTLAYHLS